MPLKTWKDFFLSIEGEFLPFLPCLLLSPSSIKFLSSSFDSLHNHTTPRITSQSITISRAAGVALLTDGQWTKSELLS